MEGLFNVIKVLIYSTFYPITHQIMHVSHEGINANISVSKTSVYRTPKTMNLAY